MTSSRFGVLLLLLAGPLFSFSQPWMQAPYFRGDSSSRDNFYAIQSAFQAYESAMNLQLRQSNDANKAMQENEEHFGGWSQFKRWEWKMEPRVFPDGDLSRPSSAWDQFQKYFQQRTAATQRVSQAPIASWQPLGPTGALFRGDYGGSARVNFLRFQPGNNQIMWTGSPGGGLWKTTDGGQNWSTNTDNLAIIGTSDVAIHPVNTDTMYLATGDANGTTSQLTQATIGVLRSVDGGLTWSTTGLSWQTSWNRNIYKLLIHPTNPRIIMAASSVGVYRSTNSGTTWSLVQSGQITDMEFKPGNPNVVYAASGIFSTGTFYRSTDGGQSFTVISAGLPLSSAVARMEIGVCPADTNLVYVGAVKVSTWDFYGFYRSTDGGTTFSLRASTPNVLSGLPSSQAWYNLSMAVNPVHKDTVVIGATYCWRTTDGGATWAQINNGSGVGLPFVHPDHHALEYLPGSDSILFSGNDGGVWRSTNNGTAWSDLNGGLQIGQVYKLSSSRMSPEKIATGHQDMGHFLRNNGSWVFYTSNCGDGMEPLFEYSNDTILYLMGYQGRALRAFNTVPLFNIIANFTGAGINAPSAWITPMIMHPTNDSVLLIGKAQVYRTTNQGSSWTQVGSVSGGASYVTGLAYAPSNPNVIYALKSNRIFVSTNGSTFTDLTGSLPVGSATLTTLTVSNTDPAKVWVGFSGYVDTIKVFMSADTGHTWVDYHSNTLPNLPVNHLYYQANSSNGVYAGMDVGAYFISDSLTGWQPFFQGLPHVDVEELEIPSSGTKIRAATNGRGVWESGLATPVPAFSTSPASLCANQSILFQDNSSGNPTSWSWTFPGANPASSTQQNPSVTYSAPGTYAVSLRAGNANGSYTMNFSVTVAASPTASITPMGPTSFCQGDSVVLQGAGGGTYSWSSGGSASTTTIYSTQTVSLTVTNANGCTAASAPLSIQAWPQPPVSISASGPLAFCQGDSVVLTANASNCSYLWSNGSTNSTITVSASQTDTLTVTDGNGCSNSASQTVTVHPLPAAPVITANGNMLSSSSASTYQWYLNGNLINGATSQSYSASQNGDYTVRITDANGCEALSAIYTYTATARENALPAEKLLVMPNPSSGLFVMKRESGKSFRVLVYSVTGEKVAEAEGASIQIDLSGMAQGTYIAEALASDFHMNVKLILE